MLDAISYNLPLDMDTDIEVNDKGARQSQVDAAFELLPPLALTLVAQVLTHGSQRYGEWNWRGLDIDDNVRHAFGHLFAYVSGDERDIIVPGFSPETNHLAKAACRALFALELAIIHETENQ